MNRYFERAFLQPLLVNKPEVVIQRMHALTQNDLLELLTFYVDNESEQGALLAVDRLPPADYTQNLLTLSCSKTLCGHKAFELLLEKSDSDKRGLYTQCIWAQAQRLDLLRPYYDPTTDADENRHLWGLLWAHNRIDCWKDMLMLFAHLPVEKLGGKANHLLDNVIARFASASHLSDQDKSEALHAFVSLSAPDTCYDFVGYIIQEYANGGDPILFNTITIFPDLVDIHHIGQSPLRWAAMHNCFDVFKFFYGLSTVDQRMNIKETLQDLSFHSQWDALESQVIKNNLHSVVGHTGLTSKRKM